MDMDGSSRVSGNCSYLKPLGEVHTGPVAFDQQGNTYILEDDVKLAKNIDTLNTYLQDQNMEEAAPLILSLAAVGHPQGQFELGRMYHLGNVTPYITKDLNEAINWYKKAVDNTEPMYSNALKIVAPSAYLRMGLACIEQAKELESPNAKDLFEIIKNPPAHRGINYL
jgi:TPR repeat protein